jgi:hypothetical protein
MERLLWKPAELNEKAFCPTREITMELRKAPKASCIFSWPEASPGREHHGGVE